MIILYPIIIPIIICLILGIIAFIYKKIRNKKYLEENYNEGDFLSREISTQIPPSIVGYLLCQKVKYKHLIADIMDLYAIKTIDIKKQKDSTLKIEFIKNENAKKITSESQQYILDTLVDKDDGCLFNYTEWKKLVMKEYKNNNWTKKVETANAIIITIIVLAYSIIGGIIGWNIEGSYGVGLVGVLVGFAISVFVICFYIAFMEIQKENGIFLNKEGKKELKKWLKLKRFMENYTLLKDRNMEEIVIYERYIPYAIALDVNVTYKDALFDIFEEEEFYSIIKDKNIKNIFERYGIGQ